MFFFEYCEIFKNIFFKEYLWMAATGKGRFLLSSDSSFHFMKSLQSPNFLRLTIYKKKFKDTHREEAPSNKAWTLSKSINMDIWVLVQQINFLFEVLKLKQNFRKSKEVTGKTLFFVIGAFCTPHFICLDIGFWQSNFFMEIFGFQLKNGTPVFLKGLAFFKKFVSKLKYENIQNFQWMSRKNMPISQTEAILKIPSTVF